MGLYCIPKLSASSGKGLFNKYVINKADKEYHILSIGAYSFKGGLLEKGGGLIFFMRKLYDNFLPAQRNVCETTMYSKNFNTTLNVLRCSTIYFSAIHICHGHPKTYISIFTYRYICFKMFMTYMTCYVILAKLC